MQKFQSRLPDVGTSIFAVMTRLAHEHNAINLSQGFPDFRIDDVLIELVHRYMMDGHNQYAPMPGLLALRDVIAQVIQKTYHRTVDAETEITITAGATEALYASIAAFIGPNDEVILFDPSYDSYDPAIRLNGGIPVHINLRFPGFSIDWEQVDSAITPRTKMIMVNTPHNPGGRMLTDDDLMALERIAHEHDLIVLSDEVYERLVFDGKTHHGVQTRNELASRSIAVFSFGKTFHATGWKCGYVVAPQRLTREIRKTHQFMVFSVNTPLQWALTEYLKNPAHYLHLPEFFQKKRDAFLGGIKGSSFEPLPCEGSYFQILSYRQISDKSDIDMAEHLTIRSKVASIPVSVFYKDKTDNRLLRFCFAKKEDTLSAACDILRKI